MRKSANANGSEIVYNNMRISHAVKRKRKHTMQDYIFDVVIKYSLLLLRDQNCVFVCFPFLYLMVLM